jgi:lipopolysaccharide export system protein LptC
MASSHVLRKLLGQLTLYLPIGLMTVLALGSWWLARSTPAVTTTVAQPLQRSEPDYFFTQFSMRDFDAQGQLASEIWGKKARHMPATDVLEIDDARFRSLRSAQTTLGQADRAYSNGDGSEVQLVGNAVIVRPTSRDAAGQESPRMEFRGEFLHAFLRTEVVKSHKPVVMQRGADQFSSNAMQYNKMDGIVQLDGRVRVRFESKNSTDVR